MNTSCFCMPGIAASSKKPVKRYNNIIKELFTNTEPILLQGYLDPTVEKKVKKLYEYVDFLPYRAPKVSRRLARHLFTSLERGQSGDVKLAVYAYAFLLERLPPETALLFAREVIVEPVDGNTLTRLAKDARYSSAPFMRSVVGSLLCQDDAALQILGTHLLLVFTKIPGSSSYFKQLEGFVPLVCTNAAAQGPERESNPLTRVATTMKRIAAKDAGTVPHAGLLLQLTSLRALQVHLLMTDAASVPSHHTKLIIEQLLDTFLESPPKSATLQQGQRSSMLLPTLSKTKVTTTADSDGSLLSSFNLELPAADVTPSNVAFGGVTIMARLMKDPVEGRLLLSMVWDYMASRSLWDSPARAKCLLQVLTTAVKAEGQEQSLLLFTSLCVEAGAAQRCKSKDGFSGRTVAVQALRELSSSFDSQFRQPAMVTALRELPKQLPEATTAPSEAAAATTATAESNNLRAAIFDVLHTMGSQYKGDERALMLDLVGGVLSGVLLTDTTGVSRAMVECANACTDQLAADSTGFDLTPGYLRASMRLLVGGSIPIRLEAHKALHRLLRRCKPLTELQQKELLSALWHEVRVSNTPANIAAKDVTLRYLLQTCPQAASTAADMASSLATAAASPASKSSTNGPVSNGDGSSAAANGGAVIAHVGLPGSDLHRVWQVLLAERWVAAAEGSQELLAPPAAAGLCCTKDGRLSVMDTPSVGDAKQLATWLAAHQGKHAGKADGAWQPTPLQRLRVVAETSSDVQLPRVHVDFEAAPRAVSMLYVAKEEEVAGFSEFMAAARAKSQHDIFTAEEAEFSQLAANCMRQTADSRAILAEL